MMNKVEQIQDEKEMCEQAREIVKNSLNLFAEQSEFLADDLAEFKASKADIKKR